MFAKEESELLCGERKVMKKNAKIRDGGGTEEVYKKKKKSPK